MTDIDLTGPVEAAAQAIDPEGYLPRRSVRHMARRCLTAAAPLIEAQVRASERQRFEAMASAFADYAAELATVPDRNVQTIAQGLAEAVRVVRGQA